MRKKLPYFWANKHMLLGKYVIFAALASMFLFPEEIFPALVGMAIILFVVLFVVELVLDVYIVAKVMMQDKREKNDEKKNIKGKR